MSPSSTWLLVSCPSLVVSFTQGVPYDLQTCTNQSCWSPELLRTLQQCPHEIQLLTVQQWFIVLGRGLSNIQPTAAQHLLMSFPHSVTHCPRHFDCVSWWIVLRGWLPHCASRGLAELVSFWNIYMARCVLWLNVTGELSNPPRIPRFSIFYSVYIKTLKSDYASLMHLKSSVLLAFRINITECFISKLFGSYCLPERLHNKTLNSNYHNMMQSFFKLGVHD